MKRRSFLKLASVAPVAACVPLAAKAKVTGMTDKYFVRAPEADLPLIKPSDYTFNEYEEFNYETMAAEIIVRATVKVEVPGRGKLTMLSYVDKEFYDKNGRDTVIKFLQPQFASMMIYKVKDYDRATKK